MPAHMPDFLLLQKLQVGQAAGLERNAANFLASVEQFKAANAQLAAQVNAQQQHRAFRRFDQFFLRVKRKIKEERSRKVTRGIKENMKGEREQSETNLHLLSRPGLCQIDPQRQKGNRPARTPQMLH